MSTKVFGRAPTGRHEKPGSRRPTGVARHPPITTRGPKGYHAPADSAGPPPKPNNLTATEPEWITYWYLSQRIGKGAFDFQSSVQGGRSGFGGLVADFMLPGRIGPAGLVINIQGSHFHRFTTEERMADLNTKSKYQDQGYEVVYVLDTALIHGGYRYVLEQALQGVQVYDDST